MQQPLNNEQFWSKGSPRKVNIVVDQFAGCTDCDAESQPLRLEDEWW